MTTNAPGVGHVAIVKGVAQQDSNNIIVTLIEDNMTLLGESSFAINRTMLFTKASNGTWSSSYKLDCNGCTQSYSVVGWATPISLP